MSFGFTLILQKSTFTISCKYTEMVFKIDKIYFNTDCVLFNFDNLKHIQCLLARSVMSIKIL